MPSYISHLRMMYKLAKKTGIDKHVFNAVYVVEFQSITKNFPRECFDFLHYATERMVWERFWPTTPFPGTDPRRVYRSFLPFMKMTAGLAGFSDAEFNEIWIKSLLAVQPLFKHLGMDVVQYEAEKLFWDSHWLGVHPFEGKDPRTTLGYVRADARVGLMRRGSGFGSGSGDTLGYVGFGTQQRGSGSGNGSGDAIEYFSHISGTGLKQCGSGSGNGSGDAVEYFRHKAEAGLTQCGSGSGNGSGDAVELFGGL